jgi:(1->4)-alpha-D-glucan 1-alpha-D-glucosylmutase
LGLYNSLSQTLLKLTAPGVPDIYQGSEAWEFSLVDPDNRRPVDYRAREAMLEDLKRLEALSRDEKLAMLKDLVKSMGDGRLKLYVTWKALSFRRASAALFREGAYHPLNVAGCKSDHVCAYARQHGELEVLVIVPRLVARLLGPHADTFPPSIWEDTHVELPAPAGASFSNILSGEVIAPIAEGGAPSVALSAALADLPVALLQRH